MTSERWGDGPEELYQRRMQSVGGKGRPRGASSRVLGQWTVAIMLVVGSVLGAAYLYAEKGSTFEVLVLARDVPAGQQITSQDLSTAQVSGVEATVAAEDAADVIGRYAMVSFLPGQVLNPDAVTTQPMPAEGERLVAVNIPAGRLPGGVTTGSAVEVLAAPAPGEGATQEQLAEPQVIAARASAFSVEQADDGTVILTLLLPDSDADVVAAHSAVGAVALVQIPVGE